MDDTGMKQASAEQDFRDADWKLLGLRLLAFARYWAQAHYGWHEGCLLPMSKTPEDIACEVYVAFSRGERVFRPDIPMWLQLKSAVKSVLWNLHQLKEGRITRAESPEFFDPRADENAGPDVALHSEEFCQRCFHLLYADQRVKKSDDLCKTIQALEEGAQTVEEFVKETGLTTARVYELRRQLKVVAESVLNKLSREENSHGQPLPKRSPAAA
jgi:hypothetical protein